MTFWQFKEYCSAKLKANHALESLYKGRLFRKLKLNFYLNRQRSEQRMIENFKRKFGDDCLLAWGNYERRRGFRGKESTPGRHLRDVFRRNGFSVLLVDEHKTSRMCFNCKEGRCEKFMTRPDPRPFKRGKDRLVHGLLKCTTCECVWNRDANGAKNILFAAKSILDGKGRPAYLSRDFSSVAFHDATNHNSS